MRAEAPARAFGLFPTKGAVVPGADADLAIVDLARDWTLADERLHSAARISPWHGRPVRGRPLHTLVRGRFVVRDGVLDADARGWGRPVHPIQAMPPARVAHADTTLAAVLRRRP